LLVDDEPDILEIVGITSTRKDIFTAANGKEAIAKAKRNLI
jgi:DNA-binding response OmpR family regulator